MLGCGVREVAALRLEPWRPGSDAACLTTKHLCLRQRVVLCRPCVQTVRGDLSWSPLGCTPKGSWVFVGSVTDCSA